MSNKLSCRRCFAKFLILLIWNKFFFIWNIAQVGFTWMFVNFLVIYLLALDSWSLSIIGTCFHCAALRVFFLCQCVFSIIRAYWNQLFWFISSKDIIGYVSYEIISVDIKYKFWKLIMRSAAVANVYRALFIYNLTKHEDIFYN